MQPLRFLAGTRGEAKRELGAVTLRKRIAHAQAAPATVSGESLDHDVTMRKHREGGRAVVTREPGDLPTAS
jgi:hypothetical protein